MAIVNLVSNLRAYNPKFSDFGVTQVVDQPIPAESNRTAPSNLDRRQDDFKRLESFLASGKGQTFALKQAGLDQAARGTSVKERIGEAANTAARLANILLQVEPKAALLAGEAGVPQTGVPGEIIRYSPEVTTRFSSHPFLRYIEARGLVGQIGNLLRADAPSLARRGRTIIPDNEWETPNAGEQSEEGLRGFFRRIGKFYNSVRSSEAFTENIEKNPTSLRSTFFSSEGSKFDNPVSNGYVVDPVSGSAAVRAKAGYNSFIDQSVGDNIPLTNASAKSIDEGPDSLKSGLPFTNLKPGFNTLTSTTYTNNIRTKARGAGREGGREGGRFRTRQPYAEQFSNFVEAFDENVSHIKIDVITPSLTRRIEFPAYIESFTDSYSGNWNGTSYIGRAEQVYNYTGFSRDYNFSFKVASLTALDLMNLYERLNILASTTAPTYSETLTFMRGTYVRLKIGEYLDSTPGFLTNVSFSWNTTYPWQAQSRQKYKTIDNAGQLDTRGEIGGTPLVPHILDVSCNFTPVHDFIPQTNINNNITSPYITDGRFTYDFISGTDPNSDDPNTAPLTVVEPAIATPAGDTATSTEIEATGPDEDFNYNTFRPGLQIVRNVAQNP